MVGWILPFRRRAPPEQSGSAVLPEMRVTRQLFRSNPRPGRLFHPSGTGTPTVGVPEAGTCPKNGQKSPFRGPNRAFYGELVGKAKRVATPMTTSQPAQPQQSTKLLPWQTRGLTGTAADQLKKSGSHGRFYNCLAFVTSPPCSQNCFLHPCSRCLCISRLADTETADGCG